MSTDRFQTVMLNAQHGRTAILDAATWAKPWLVAGHKLHLEVRKETRSTASNRIMWSILTDIAAQVEWFVDGKTSKLKPEDWKHILSAGLKKHQRIAAGIDGGFVILGQRTSEMTQAEMSDLIELAYAFGADKGVQWSRTSLGRDVPDEVAA